MINHIQISILTHKNDAYYMGINLTPTILKPIEYNKGEVKTRSLISVDRKQLLGRGAFGKVFKVFWKTIASPSHSGYLVAKIDILRLSWKISDTLYKQNTLQICQLNNILHIITLQNKSQRRFFYVFYNNSHCIKPPYPTPTKECSTGRDMERYSLFLIASK